MKEFITKLKMTFAVIKAHKSVVFIDNGGSVTRYAYRLSEEEIADITTLDF